MRFDAGCWGLVEVDRVEREEDHVTGVRNPGDLLACVIYSNYGKDGCARIRCAPAETNEATPAALTKEQPGDILE